MRIIVAIFLVMLLFGGCEIVSISWMANTIGFLPTVAVVLLTGIVGAFIAKENAKIAILNLKNGNFSSGNPGRQMFDAVIFFIAAAFLIIPGLITDVFGLILLLPPVRSYLYKTAVKKSGFSGAAAPGEPFQNAGNGQNAKRYNPSIESDEDVIDVDVVE